MDSSSIPMTPELMAGMLVGLGIIGHGRLPWSLQRHDRLRGAGLQRCCPLRLRLSAADNASHKERCSAGVSERAFMLWMVASGLMTFHALTIGAPVFVVLGLRSSPLL